MYSIDILPVSGAFWLKRFNYLRLLGLTIFIAGLLMFTIPVSLHSPDCSYQEGSLLAICSPRDYSRFVTLLEPLSIQAPSFT